MCLRLLRNPEGFQEKLQIDQQISCRSKNPAQLVSKARTD